MDRNKPHCLYCGGMNLERQSYRIGYECRDCKKFMSDLAMSWSCIEKGKIKNDRDGRVAILNPDGESFTTETLKETVP